MRKIIALFATLALLLALFACGKPGAPAEPLDLAAFAESPMAFDLTDLAGFLTPQQLAGLEAALRDDLAARGLEDCTALYFADPPAGCVKIPFANESGADLSNLNTEQLARHIAGQVVEAFEGKGVDVGTSTAITTTTKATTVSATTNTTTGSTSTTTTTKISSTQKAEINPQTLYLNDSQLFVRENPPTEFPRFGHPLIAANGFNFRWTIESGETFLVHIDKSYFEDYKNTFRRGTKQTVGFYKQTGSGKYSLIKTKTYTIENGTYYYDNDGSVNFFDGGYIILVAADPREYPQYYYGEQRIFYNDIVDINVGDNTGVSYCIWLPPSKSISTACEWGSPDLVKLF